MKKRAFSAAGLIIFIAGALVLAFAFLMLSPLFAFRQAEYIFSCISVSLIYLAYFLPVLIGSFGGDIAGVAASGAIYYKGVSAYSAVTVIDIALTFVFMPLPLSIVIECVALFVLFIWVFMALLTKEHIDSSLRDENEIKSLVMELRSRAGRLASITAGLDRNNAIRVRAEKIAEDMRYLSPSNSGSARDFERKLLAILDAILMEGAVSSGEGVITASLQNKFNEFDVLYRERKSMN